LITCTELTAYRGDNKNIRVRIVDGDGVPRDTTGWTIEYQLRVNAEDADPPVVAKTSATPGEVDAVDVSKGIWDVKLLPADTNQTAGVYVWDVQATTGAAEIYTVAFGTLQILQDVTR